MQSVLPATPPTRSPGRRWRRIGALGLAALLLVGCAQRAPHPSSGQTPAAAPLSDVQARQLISQWQRQLAAHLAEAGGDPAALARLPAQRATGTLRPGRIGFAVLDLDASLAERDGFDVQGLLLGPLAGAGPQPFVFVVGTVQRQGYRPVDLVDLRLVALTLRGGQPDWSVGDADRLALQRYRTALPASLTLRFPADQDRFELARCDAGLCAAERGSGAQWQLAWPAAAQAGAASP